MASSSPTSLAVIPPPPPHPLPPNVHPEKTGLLLDWIHSAGASSPSTWNTSPNRKLPIAQGEDNIHSPQKQKQKQKRRKRCRKPLEESSGNHMPQRRGHSVMVGPDSDIPAGKPQDSRRHSPRKGSPAKKAEESTTHPSTLHENVAAPSGQIFESPDGERTPRSRSFRAPNLRYEFLPRLRHLSIASYRLLSPPSHHPIL